MHSSCVQDMNLAAKGTETVHHFPLVFRRWTQAAQSHRKWSYSSYFRRWTSAAQSHRSWTYSPLVCRKLVLAALSTETELIHLLCAGSWVWLLPATGTKHNFPLVLMKLVSADLSYRNWPCSHLVFRKLVSASLSYRSWTYSPLVCRKLVLAALSTETEVLNIFPSRFQEVGFGCSQLQELNIFPSRVQEIFWAAIS